MIGIAYGSVRGPTRSVRIIASTRKSPGHPSRPSRPSRSSVSVSVWPRESKRSRTSARVESAPSHGCAGGLIPPLSSRFERSRTVGALARFRRAPRTSERRSRSERAQCALQGHQLPKSRAGSRTSNSLGVWVSRTHHPDPESLRPDGPQGVPPRGGAPRATEPRSRPHSRTSYLAFPVVPEVDASSPHRPRGRTFEGSVAGRARRRRAIIGGGRLRNEGLGRDAGPLSRAVARSPSPTGHEAP